MTMQRVGLLSICIGECIGETERAVSTGDSSFCVLFFFISPLENFSVSVAAVDDAYD